MTATAHAIATGGNSGRTAALNDALRQTGRGGRVMMTAGIAALPDGDRLAIIEAVRTFECFDETNDPYGERGLGTLTVEGRRVLWKIDYFDRELRYASPDPTDPCVTARVLTIMMADEY